MSTHEGSDTTRGAVSLLMEQQRCLQQFMMEWCSRQEHILQSHAREQSVFSAQTATSVVITQKTNGSEICSEFKNELPPRPRESLHTEQIMCQVESHGLDSIHHRETAEKQQVRPSIISDPLGVLRSTTQALQTKSSIWREVSSLSLPGAESARTKPRLVSFVSSKKFEALTAACILANAVVVAHAADHAADNINHSENLILDKLEDGFAFFYIIELALRLAAYKCDFFRGQDRAWNIFDTLLVVGAAFDLIMSFTLQSQVGNWSDTFQQVVRLLKVVRILRMVRIMRMFKELRMIVCSIQSSAKFMFWAVVLIANITYVVGICFLQAGTSYLQQGVGNVPQKEIEAIQTHWGSVSKAMRSLYMASTGGESWRNLAEPLLPVGQFFYMLFLLYIAFFMFVVVNTVTSLFVEATMNNADKDWRMVVREEMQKKNDYVKKAEQLFEFMDRDSSGDVTEDEFQKYATNPQMAAFASSLDLDVSDITQFYKMLSCRGRYSVDAETFVVGCLKLRGTARSLDLQGLIVSQSRALRSLEDLTECCRESAALIRDALVPRPVIFPARELSIPAEDPVARLPED